MRILVVACLLLVGCDPVLRHKCIDGVLYQQIGGKDAPWIGIDAAPAHKGFTPTPCKPSDGDSEHG